MKAKPLLLCAALLAGLGALFLLARQGPQRSEEERIREVLDTARHGVAVGDPREVMAGISRDYEDGNYTYDTLRTLIGFGLRQYQEMQLTLYVKGIRVQGEKATVGLEVQATGAGVAGDTARYRGFLRLQLAREPARRRLVFPDHRWRAVRVENMSDIQDAFGR